MFFFLSTCLKLSILRFVAVTHFFFNMYILQISFFILDFDYSPGTRSVFDIVLQVLVGSSNDAKGNSMEPTKSWCFKSVDLSK